MFSSLVLKQVTEVFDIYQVAEKPLKSVHMNLNLLFPGIRQVVFTYAKAFEELVASICRV
jgi:hypothetical protein